MDGKNMAGVSMEERPDRIARRNAVGCLALAACGLLGLIALAGWLVYLACNAWPALCEALCERAELSLWLAGGATLVAAVAGCVDIREG